MSEIHPDSAPDFQPDSQPDSQPESRSEPQSVAATPASAGRDPVSAEVATYRLLYPASAPKQPGFEVQCLAGKFGWINALVDHKEREVVFADRPAAEQALRSLVRRPDLEYRIYPSLPAPRGKR